MTTYIIYSDANDGYIRSTNQNYATAQAGSNLLVDTTGDHIFTGLNVGWDGTKHLYQGFLSFDTSVIADAEEIVDSTLTVYNGYHQNQSVEWGQQFLNYNWTAPLTTASWRTQAQLKATTLAANIDHLFSATPFTTRVTGRDTLITSISKTSTTKFVVVSNWQTDGIGYTNGVLENWIYSGSTTNKPYLTVYTTALNVLNSVVHATTSLPDGTTVGIRSNGSASQTLTVGYTPLNGVWTSLGTLHADFNKDIDGTASLSMTSDSAGNFYILGTSATSGSSLTGQAWVRTGTSNVWTAKTPLSAPLPQGNEQAVRSTAMVYMDGGTDGKDKACIYAVAARGSGGNRPGFAYHVSGAGWTHDMSINVTNLKAGTGWLYHGTVNGFAYTTATGIPAVVDMVKLGPNLAAVYVARGKFGSTTVGGITVMGMYNTGGIVKSWDTTYIATGAAKLVAISPNLFAHVFDNGGSKLSVRFYNAASQVMGQAEILASAFYGGVIGQQWAAYYDKTANVVRVVYVAAAGSTTLNRFDVSPVTYVGTTASAITTTFGAAGSTTSILRAASTTDERFVPIEGANKTSGGTLSAVVYNSTVGNVAPTAPSLTTRGNFDVTSAADFKWKFGDANPADYQTAYDLEISRVSDSVVVYNPGKIESTSESMTLEPSSAAINNYVLNPLAYGVSTGFGIFSLGTAEAGTTTFPTGVTDGPRKDITSYGRWTVTSAKTGGSCGWSAVAAANRAPRVGVAGDTHTTSVWIRYTGPGTINVAFRMYYYSSAGALVNYEDTTSSTLQSGVWTKLSKTLTATGSYASVAWWAYHTAAYIAPVGATIDVTGAMVTESSATEFFSGASAPTANRTHAWTGTAHASSSTATHLNTLANGVNYRWRVRAYDVIGATGTYSGYGTFTTAATGTLSITSPAADNEAGIETAAYNVTWSYTQTDGQTQSQRQVRVIRTSDNYEILDTGMVASTSNSYQITGMESGKEYRVEVSIINSASVASPVISRYITPNYSSPMTPEFDVSVKEDHIEITTINPIPTGDRPEVIKNEIFRRVAKADATESDFVRIAIVTNSSVYKDYAVKSGVSYDYRIIGQTV